MDKMTDGWLPKGLMMATTVWKSLQINQQINKSSNSNQNHIWPTNCRRKKVKSPITFWFFGPKKTPRFHFRVKYIYNPIGYPIWCDFYPFFKGPQITITPRNPPKSISPPSVALHADPEVRPSPPERKIHGTSTWSTFKWEPRWSLPGGPRTDRYKWSEITSINGRK